MIETECDDQDEARSEVRGESGLAGRRVLLLALGTRGDVEPAARLARALTGRGARVAVAVLADGAERVGAAGAVTVVVGPPAAQAMWWRSPTARAVAQLNPGIGYAQLRSRLATGARQIAAALLPALRGADVVLSGLATARVVPVLDRAGLPARLVLHAPLLPHRQGTSAWERPALALLPPDVEEHRQQLMWRMTTGLSQAVAAAVARGLAGRPTPRPSHDDLAGTAYPPLLTTSPVLDPDPAPDLVQTGHWPDPAPVRPLDPALAAWLDDHPGAVLLTQGSLPLTSPDAQAARLLAVARAVGRPALLQLPGVEPGPRDGGLVVAETDHRALLPRVAAVVHHGGSGTTHAVTAAGVPQVVVPQLGDQPHYARQVHRRGLGPAPLPVARATRRALVRRLGQALEPEVHRTVQAVAARMAGEDGLGRAVDEVARMR